jgi:hypothetical protein
VAARTSAGNLETPSVWPVRPAVLWGSGAVAAEPRVIGPSCIHEGVAVEVQGNAALVRPAAALVPPRVAAVPAAPNGVAGLAATAASLAGLRQPAAADPGGDAAPRAPRAAERTFRRAP